MECTRGSNPSRLPEHRNITGCGRELEAEVNSCVVQAIILYRGAGSTGFEAISNSRNLLSEKC